MKKTTFLLASAALSLAATAQAAEVSTDPVGYKNTVIKGDNGLSLVGVQFVEAAVFNGQFSSTATSTVTVSGADFDALLDSNTTYFLDVISSATEGVAGLNTNVVSWSGDTLTLGDDLSSVLTVDADVISLHPLPTISDIFGVGGDVLAAGTALDADLIYVADPDAEGLLRIYYSSGGFAGTGWRAIGKGNADYANFPVYHSDGLLVFKKSSGDVTLTFSGAVKMTSTSTVVEAGYSPFNVIYPSGATLGNSGLYDAENPANSIVAGTALTADVVYLDSDGDGQLERYYYSSGGFAGAGWREIGGGNTDKSGVAIESGFAIFNRNSAITLEREPAY